MTTATPQCLIDYVNGLHQHDVNAVAAALSDDLMFISATRILGKPQFLAMLEALYCGFPDWNYQYTEVEDRGQGNYAIMWRQGGTHTGTWTMPGMAAIPPTGKRVQIPPHYFFYRIASDRLVLIFPEPIIGGAPRGILEQLGMQVPPL